MLSNGRFLGQSATFRGKTLAKWERRKLCAGGQGLPYQRPARAVSAKAEGQKEDELRSISYPEYYWGGCPIVGVPISSAKERCKAPANGGCHKESYGDYHETSECVSKILVSKCKQIVNSGFIKRLSDRWLPADSKPSMASEDPTQSLVIDCHLPSSFCCLKANETYEYVALHLRVFLIIDLHCANIVWTKQCV